MKWRGRWKTCCAGAHAHPLAVCAMTACGDEAPPQATTASGPQLVSAPPPRDALPDCPRLASALGDMVAGLDMVDAAGTRQDTPESYGISCAWRSQEDGAAVGAIVIVDNEPLTAQDMQRAGMYVADPRLAALDGFIAVPDARFEGSEALGPVGPQVIVFHLDSRSAREAWPQSRGSGGWTGY